MDIVARRSHAWFNMLSRVSLKTFRIAAIVVLATVLAPRTAAASSILDLLHLPFDLLARIITNDSSAVRVIVEAPQDVVDSLARTYGVTVVKRMYSGAVGTSNCQPTHSSV